MNNILKTLLLPVILAIAVPIPVSADDLPSFPFLQVKGTAKADVRPDKATLRVKVSAFSHQSDVAVDTVQKQLIALLATLAKYSIPDDAITSYNLVKVIEREQNDRVESKISGYQVSRQLKVELLDISQFAELIADIARLDNVYSLDADFDVTSRTTIESRLMVEAGVDARRIAENMVQGMSRNVGSVYAISESSIHSSVARYSLAADRYYPAMMAMAADYTDTIFQPSTIELTQSVHVMFALE